MSDQGEHDMVMFKIRDKNTGLYSCGGLEPRKWTKQGKAWASEATLKNHLTLATRGPWNYSLRRYETKEIPESWEIVTFTEVETAPPYSARVLAQRPAKK